VGRAIQQSLNESVFVPPELEKVSKAALIFDGQEALMEFIDVDKIFSVFKKGKAVETFEGNYHNHNGKVTLFLSGLDWCNSRLNQIQTILNRDNDKIQATLSQSEVFKSGAGDLLSKIKKQPEPNSRSISDIINKYRR
jgi:hypothetical protein